MVIPRQLVSVFSERLGVYSCTVPTFEQLVLALLIESGDFERHINRMKKIYKRKRRALLDALSASSLDAFTKVEGSEAGLHLLLKIQNGMSEETLLDRAAKQGVLLHGLSEYRMEAASTPSPPIILLGYTTIPENDIEKAVKKLEKAWTL